MGYCLEGQGKMSVEVRRESFYVHTSYGYTPDGDHTPDSDHFGKRWREVGHPEFLLEDLDDLIAALEEARDHVKGTALVRPLAEARFQEIDIATQHDDGNRAEVHEDRKDLLDEVTRLRVIVRRTSLVADERVRLAEEEAARIRENERERSEEREKVLQRAQAAESRADAIERTRTERFREHEENGIKLGRHAEDQDIRAWVRTEALTDKVKSRRTAFGLVADALDVRAKELKRLPEDRIKVSFEQQVQRLVARTEEVLATVKKSRAERNERLDVIEKKLNGKR